MSEADEEKEGGIVAGEASPVEGVENADVMTEEEEVAAGAEEC